MSGDSERPDEDVRRKRDERTLGADEETLDGTGSAAPLDDSDDLETLATEVPTVEVDLARDDRTVHEAAAPSVPPAVARGDHEATLAPSDEPQRTLGDDEETLAGGPDTEAPTSEIDLRRGQGTVPGGFAGTEVGSRGSRGTISEEDETVFEAGQTESLRDGDATAVDAAAGSRRRGNVRRIDPGGTRGVSATARDAAAAGYTEKGGRAADLGGPMRLVAGASLAQRYTLEKRLGKGGMGEVWKASHNLLKGDFAIKVIKASISKDKSFRKRFLTEGQTMMRVKHPGVVEVTDLDETRDNNELFMVMQYLEGRTLYDAIRDKEKPLADDVRNVVRIFKELADGMQRIHDVRIVHKDLKSDNSLLVRGDDGLEHPKVIDFGLAKSLDDADGDVKAGASGVDGTYDPDLRTTLSGTLAYMAPEQFLGNPSSFQSDIYAFGVMLFECFNKGEYPLPRGGLAHYLQLHAEGKTPALLREKRPDLPAEIADLSDRCMAPRKADRPESFAEVSHALQWWLDAPERRRRRNRALMLVGGAVFLVALAITGFLMAETTASLSGFQATAGGRIVRPVDGVVHLGERGLAALELSAEISGEPKEPRLEIDGRRVDAEIRSDLGRLTAVADVSALPDGEHDIALLASANASPAKMRVALDRKAPGIRSVDVPGVPGARDGFVASEAPEVRVELDEGTIASVVARVDGRSQISGEPAAGEDGPRNLWVVRGTADGDGAWSMEIEAKDLAGNVSTQRFSYVRDTEPPAPVVRDLGADGSLPVRSGVGAKLVVALSEPGTAELRVPGAAPVTRTAASAGALEFDLPPVPAAGYTAALVVTDRAGSTRTFKMAVQQVADVASITALDGGSAPAAAKGDKDVRLSFRRTYALQPGSAVTAVRVRDAAGVAVSEPPQELSVRFENAGTFASDVVIPRGQLGEGTWRLSPTGQGGAAAQSYELTLDATAPRIHGVTVRDGSGRVVADGAWSLTREVTVDVDAEDLALAAIKIEGFDGPTPSPGSGRITYRFTRTFDADGAFSASIALTDAAGNRFDRPLGIRVDATDPVLNLAEPTERTALDDRDGARFAGECSEAPFTLHVAGDLVLDGPVQSVQRETLFSGVQVALQSGKGALRVWVTDDAGRRSAERVLRVSVERREVELPDTITWPQGVTATMEKVRAGDVFFGGRVFPVPLGFVDRCEVTNAQYRRFLEAVAQRGDAAWRHPDQPEGWDHTPSADTWGDPAWNADDLPVVNVAFWDAYAFAAWTGRRLPTEAEWVKAAAKREGDLDLLRWPTGNEWVEGLLVTAELVASSAFQGPASAVDGGDVSPNGCLNMGGNVSEWVRLERVQPGEDDAAVRGGNWYLSRVAADVRTVRAKRYDRSRRAATIGFRCAVDAESVRGAPTR